MLISRIALRSVKLSSYTALLYCVTILRYCVTQSFAPFLPPPPNAPGFTALGPPSLLHIHCCGDQYCKSCRPVPSTTHLQDVFQLFEVCTKIFPRNFFKISSMTVKVMRICMKIPNPSPVPLDLFLLGLPQVYCLPDSYEVEDRSLEVIRYVLNPTFKSDEVTHPIVGT